MDSTEELIELLANPRSFAMNELIRETLQSRGIEQETKESYKVFDIEPLLDDFRSLEPGSNLWSRYWKAHPEKQSVMLEWKELLKGGIFTYA